MSIKLANVYTGLVLFLVLAPTTAAFGQRPLRRYQPPAGPTLSPYLNYNRPDFSTLPSDYQSFIVPQQRLQRNLYDLARTQQADFRRLEQNIQQVRTSAAAPTGTGAGFMNYSHYYPTSQKAAKR
jgi:hypothetical protein